MRYFPTFNGDISVIKYHGGLVARDPLWIELWTPGTIHIVKEPKQVAKIKSILKEFKGMVKRGSCNPSEEKIYLRYKLEEEGW